MTKYKFPIIFFLNSQNSYNPAESYLTASLLAGNILVQLADYDNARIKQTQSGEWYLEAYVQQAPTATTFKEAGYSPQRPDTGELREVEKAGATEVSTSRPSKRR